MYVRSNRGIDEWSYYVLIPIKCDRNNPRTRLLKKYLTFSPTSPKFCTFNLHVYIYAYSYLLILFIHYLYMLICKLPIGVNCKIIIIIINNLFFSNNELLTKYRVCVSFFHLRVHLFFFFYLNINSYQRYVWR